MRDGAQNLEIEGEYFLHASEMCWDVVKRDLRFRKRIHVLSNSSGLLSYGSETVLRGLQRYLCQICAFNTAGHSDCDLAYPTVRDGKKVF